MMAQMNKGAIKLPPSPTLLDNLEKLRCMSPAKYIEKLEDEAEAYDLTSDELETLVERRVEVMGPAMAELAGQKAMLEGKIEDLAKVGDNEDYRGHDANKTKLSQEERPDPDFSILIPEGKTPAFPIEVFGNAADWISQTAEGSSAEPDYVGGSLLAVVGYLIGNSHWVKIRKDWQSPPGLWLTNVGISGTGKSPGLRCCTKLLNEITKDKMPDYREKIAKYHKEYRIREGVRKLWEKNCAKADTAGKPRPLEPAVLAIPLKKPVHPRSVVRDATPEAIAGKHAEHKKGILLEGDEISTTILGIDKYSEGNRGFFLKGFNGEPESVDRKTAEPIDIEMLTLSIVGNITPDVAHELFLDNKHDGFTARFLFVWPANDKDFEMEVLGSNDTIIEGAFRKLDGLEIPEDGKPNLCELTREARTLLGVAAIEYQKMGRLADGLFSEFLAKQRGIAPRIAMNLEFLDWAIDCAGGRTTPPPDRVSKDKMALALHLLNGYFIPMYEKLCGGIGVTKDERNAARFARYLRKEKFPRFNVRDVKRHEGPLKNGKELDAALEILEEAAWIIPDGQRQGGTKGRKKRDYLVNPRIYEGQQNE